MQVISVSQSCWVVADARQKFYKPGHRTAGVVHGFTCATGTASGAALGVGARHSSMLPLYVLQRATVAYSSVDGLEQIDRLIAQLNAVLSYRSHLALT